MNDNVGDMPFEIFGDYTSDSTGMDFPWEYMALSFNSFSTQATVDYRKVHGYGTGYGYGLKAYGKGIASYNQRYGKKYGDGDYYGNYGNGQSNDFSPTDDDMDSDIGVDFL